MPDRTINTAIVSSPVFTSELVVQGHQRLNVSIRPGTSFVADPTLSVVSAVFTLQRQLPGSDADASIWRDVNSWTVTEAVGIDGQSENITTNGEPETCKYRVGAKAGDWTSGSAFLRLGTS